jgi:NifB/MoaA-like Fe-S oxidoreductase
VIGRLRSEPLGDTVVLPRVMFDRSGDVTLDDVTVAMLQRALGREVRLVDGIRGLRRLIA